MIDKIFRAYDIRGEYPKEINEDNAYIIGRSYASYLKDKYDKDICLVSHDNRLSSKSLTSNLIKGMIDSGMNVVFLGLTTTPMNYFARKVLDMPGVMVTASHNPKGDNGFKFSFDGMINARGEMIEDFKAYTLKQNFKIGKGSLVENSITDLYYKYLNNNISFGNIKRKVVIDPGNGTTALFIKEAFKNLPVDFVYINDVSDGSFPNHHPDPAVPENLSQLINKVKEENADFGISYDGDGDRIGIVKNDGEILPIEYFMIIIIDDIFDKVANKTFLYDIKCSKAIEDAIKKRGGKGICYRTGASYTQYKVHEQNLPFGCEYSGHVYFTDREDDCASAIYASIRFMEILSKKEGSLNDIVKDFPKYYSTPEIKIASSDEKKFKVTEKVKKFAENKFLDINDIDGVRITFPDGWVLVRASNTGPNITFRCESENLSKLEEYKGEYLSLINIFNNEK